MNKIIVLDENTANKIAAGEVIERPASIVKELVENSIDAGATSITVEIKNGGISYIRVTDNGMGIASDDAVICFERHATSKITSGEDLDAIQTMGFRGEALASIGAVSNVELTTRMENDELGVKIAYSGGKLISQKMTGCPVGTTFIIRDLFFNTPARYKFLKKDSTEASYIHDIITRIALSHTNISFRLIGGTSNHNDIFHTPGNHDLKSTIYNIYGRNIANHMVPVSYENNGITITGCAGKGEIAKANRNYQNVFVNKRYIKSKIVSAAADEAYKTQIMKNKFPVFVLNIALDVKAFDVNVHPAKLEVRFQNEGDIFSSIYHSLLNALNENKKIVTPFQDMVIQEETKAPSAIPISKDNTTSDHQILSKKMKEHEETFQEIKNIKNISRDQTYVQPVLSNKPDILSEPGREQKFRPEMAKEAQGDFSIFQGLISGKYIGQAFSTFLMFEYNNDLYLLDQHAAHERINYERLVEKHAANDILIQDLLVPVTLELNKTDIANVFENIQFYKTLGFEIEHFGGNSIVVRGIPSDLAIEKTEMAICEIIEMHSKANMLGPNLHKEALYSIACKMSVKANMSLKKEEVLSLLKDLRKTTNPLNCPHGRPTILKVNRKDFEKLFKRIV